MNSKNHEGEGQNVMFNDGHVEWCTSPLVGAQRDCVYTAGFVDPAGNPLMQDVAQPTAALDTIILPRYSNTGAIQP
jgi:prepilin-type processing-associated H-X9-DG protein